MPAFYFPVDVLPSTEDLPLFTLPFSDPLWLKLDDAHRNRDIPGILRNLSVKWDNDVANSLFWDCLCHQDTCHGATYASVPHLLQIADDPPAAQAAAEIAHFLGHVSMVAFDQGGCCGTGDDSMPQGLPLDLEGWHRKLDVYRSLAGHAKKDLADPDFPENVLSPPDGTLFSAMSGKLERLREILQAVIPDALAAPEKAIGPRSMRANLQADLDRYNRILALPPVDERDLQVIADIRGAFFEAQPAIAALCGRAYWSEEDPDERPYFLSGVAAALGEPGLAQLFNFGDEGHFSCASCRWGYEFITFGERMACYASPVGPEEMHARAQGDDPALLDFKDGAPNRADGFVQPNEEFETGSRAVREISKLASGLADRDNLQRLRFYTGTYSCQRCGADSGLI